MNPKVTFLESVFNPATCQPVTAREVIEAIRSRRWPKVEEVRAIFAAERKSVRYQSAKEKLPAVIFAGEFSYAAKTGLVRHSGLAVVDLDDLGDRLPGIRRQLCSLPCVYSVFLSPSGDGLKAVFRILVARDAAEHEATYRRLASYVARLLDVKPDPTSDVSRKCFVSFDPDAYLNENASEWGEDPETEGLLTASQHHGIAASQRSGISALQAIPTLSLSPNNSTAVKEEELSFDWVSDGFIPKAPKQNNELMLRIARHLLDVSQQIGRSLTVLETGRLIQRWFDLTPPEFRSHPVEHYHEELFRAIANAKVPLSQSPVQAAVKAAQSSPVPDWVASLPTPGIRLVAAICVFLQEVAGNKPFILSSYDLEGSTGIPQRTAYNHLTALCGSRRLKIVRRGKYPLANEYLLTPPAQ